MVDNLRQRNHLSPSPEVEVLAAPTPGQPLSSLQLHPALAERLLRRLLHVCDIQEAQGLLNLTPLACCATIRCDEVYK